MPGARPTVAAAPVKRPLTRRPVRSVVLALLSPETEPSQDAILAELRRVLVDGGVPPGTELPLDEVAAVFGVSHTPVREALKTLLGEGLVEHQTRAGYTVARLTRADFSELYVVREALEAAALPVAAQRATDQQRAEAAAAHEAQAAALRAGDAAIYHRGSREFHRCLVRPADMPRLLGMVEATWNITEPAQPMTLLPFDALTALQDDHTGMLRCFTEVATDELLDRSHRHADRLCSLLASLPADHAVFRDPSRGTR